MTENEFKDGDILISSKAENPCKWLVIEIDDTCNYIALQRWAGGKPEGGGLYGILSDPNLIKIGTLKDNPELLLETAPHIKISEHEASIKWFSEEHETQDAVKKLNELPQFNTPEFNFINQRLNEIEHKIKSNNNKLLGLWREDILDKEKELTENWREDIVHESGLIQKIVDAKLNDKFHPLELISRVTNELLNQTFERLSNLERRVTMLDDPTRA